MSREAFESIMAGIADASEYLRGNTKGMRVHKVEVERVDVAKLRNDLDLTQQEFADVFGVNAGTVRNWEQGIREPAGPARVLLTVIAKKPKAVLGALAEGPNKYAISSRRKKRKPAKKARGRPRKQVVARQAVGKSKAN